MGNRAEENAMGQVMRDAVKRTPPRNPIIGQARADEWDRKIDGLIIDVDTVVKEVHLIRIEQEVQQAAIRAAVRWNTIRDIIALLLLVAILACVGYNTTQFWGWE